MRMRSATATRGTSQLSGGTSCLVLLFGLHGFRNLVFYVLTLRVAPLTCCTRRWHRQHSSAAAADPLRFGARRGFSAVGMREAAVPSLGRSLIVMSDV